MQKIAQGNRGEVFRLCKDGKDVILKKHLNEEKRGAINKEIQILNKIKSLGLSFVPQIISSGDGYFYQQYIDGQRFDRTFHLTNKSNKIKLALRLLDNIYRLDKAGIIHGELIRPYNNILVHQDEIYIIDFERGRFGDFSGKNMRSYSQWLANNGLLDMSDLRYIGKLSNPDQIYDFISDKIKMKSYKKTLMISLILLILDQVSKYIFFDMKLFDNYLIYTVLNTGVSFGIQINSYIVLINSILFIGVIGYLRYYKKLGNISFALLCAGAIGNLIDRIIYNGVRDFIDFHFWPVFNFADIYLTFGMIYLAYEILKKDGK